MNIDVLNKKRKGICALSLTLTIVIIVIGAFMLILGMYNTFFFILAPIFIIVFLYLLSKFLIIPKYETLRINIIEEILKNRNKNYKIIKSKEKFDELKNYYDYKQLKLSSKQQLTIKNIDYSYVNFELLEKKGIKNYTSNINGRIIKFKSNLEPFAFILLNHQETEKYVNFLKDDFKNINYNVTSLKKYKPYVALYNDYFPIEILSCIDEINGFNCIISNGKEIIAIDLEKHINCEFRLQDELTNNNLIDYKNSINSLLKIIEKIDLFMEGNSNV